MGVKGLWSLLSPVARPIKLETLEGKRLAIDSSIWLYQFQATMRDKDGRVLVNAHVLGFLRRINKLLFHGIKPVFVFDGGAPGLKRSTIAERKRKKMGAAANHAKVAERLFAAQMRREAVKAAQAQREKQLANANAYVPPGAAYQFQPEAGDEITADDVYLEELDGPEMPRPARPSAPRHASSGERVDVAEEAADPAAEKEAAEVVAADRRRRFKNHDPYRLPDLPEPISVRSTAGSSSGGGAKQADPRMATEEELQHFIQEMRPEDFDVNSPEFRALPTEVQYEIIGDLRIRSRQQSHRRLTSMLRAAPTPLDFSRAQIENLSKRNTLTQQLLTVTDTIGTSGLHIPVRVASERNREYVLVRNPEAKGGGWVLGVRDQGTQNKPIEIEDSPQAKRRRQARARAWLNSDDEDDEVQEIPKPGGSGTVDPDLRKLRQQEMLEALTRRLTPKKATSSTDLKIVPRKQAPGVNPLFEQDEVREEEDLPAGDAEEQMQLDQALAASLMEEDAFQGTAVGASTHLASDEEDTDMQDALAASYGASASGQLAYDTPGAGPSRTSPERDSDEESFEEVIVPLSKPTTPEEPYEGEKLEPVAYFPPTTSNAAVAETVAEILPDDKSLSSVVVTAAAKSLQNSGDPDSLKQERKTGSTPAAEWGAPALPREKLSEHETAILADKPAIEVKPPSMQTVAAPTPAAFQKYASPAAKPAASQQAQPSAVIPPQIAMPKTPIQPDQAAAVFRPEESNSMAAPPPQKPASPILERSASAWPSMMQEGGVSSTLPNLPPMESPAEMEATASPALDRARAEPLSREPSAPATEVSDEEDEPVHDNLAQTLLRHKSMDGLTDDEADDVDDSRSMSWSPSASPEPRHTQGAFPTPPPDLEEDEGGIDINAEGDDYARFIAQIKGRNLDQVRQEIDNEIRTLNMQNKVAMRDSEDITQHMIAQIQLLLRLFGIPYITAPMEAEAQCAKLAELNLVDGVITDDNDVFLFGGSQCFKNLFNDAKYVECFLASDLDRELSLTRERLITIAYLLGSDYTIGLPHVGPIVAMELMANFPGPNGLHEFKKWWWDVQNGRDKPEEATKWMKSFKRKYSETIFLGPDWPNPLVREAYNMPTVDESDEPFQWGFPDLTGLRSFLQAELSWSISKADDELTPIVQRIALRGQTGGLNKQTRLDPFFDMSLGTDAYIPRVRAKHPSKRLQSVIKAYREAEARARGEAIPTGFGEMLKDLEEAPLVKVDEVEGGEEGADGKKPRVKRKSSKTGEEGEKRKRKTPVKRQSSGVVSVDGAGADSEADPPAKKRRAATRKPSNASSRASGSVQPSRETSVAPTEDGLDGAPVARPRPLPKPRKKKQTIEI